MDRRAVDHAPILQCKSGVVIGTLNTVTHQGPFGKRSTEVGARFGYGKEPFSPTNQQNRDAIVPRSSWLAIHQLRFRQDCYELWRECVAICAIDADSVFVD
jgi:hypothetical protein